MSIEGQLREEIIQECEKLILRHHEYHNHVHAEWVRSKARIKDTPAKVIQTPEYWQLDQKFNPFYVKSKASAIAKSIAKKIAEKTYVPNDPFSKSIQKVTGGTRELTIYQIPDAS